MVRGLLRSAPTALAALLVVSACTSGGESTGTSEPTSAASDSSEQTTTTAPPVVRGLGENLSLTVGQCFADVPEAPTTTTTTAPTTTALLGSAADGETTTTVAPTTTEPPAPTTTIARPPTVAVVDCAGTREGVVYATLCIGSLVAEDEPLDQPDDLGTVGCPGDPDLLWPGDRLLRRSSARECLMRFEQQYGEPYSESEIGTTEFVPSKGVWDRGIRSVVCTADDTAP